MPMSLEEFANAPAQDTKEKPKGLAALEAFAGVAAEERASWGEVFSDIPAQALNMLRMTETGFRLDMVQRKLKDDPTNPELKREWDSLVVEARQELKEAKEAQTPGATWIQRGVQSGIASLPTSLTALTAGLATGPVGPAVALGTMYAATSWQKYAELLAQGQDIDQAKKHAMFQGAVESVTELFPTLKLLNKAPFFKKLVGTMLADVPGEVAATFFQGASDTIADAQRNGVEVTPDLAVRALWEQHKEIPTTIVASLVGSGVQSTMMSGVNRLTGRVIEETDPKNPKKDPKKARNAFDELAAKHPNKAKEVADHVAKADPALGKELAGKVNKWINASEEDLRKIGETQVGEQLALDPKEYKAKLKEIDKKLQAKDMTPEEKKEVESVFAAATRKELELEKPAAASQEEAETELPWERQQPIPAKREEMADADLSLRQVKVERSSAHKKKIRSALYPNQSIKRADGSIAVFGGPSRISLQADTEAQGLVRSVVAAVPDLDGEHNVPGGVSGFLDQAAKVVSDEPMAELLRFLSGKVQGKELHIAPWGHEAVQGYAGYYQPKGGAVSKGYVVMGVNTGEADTPGFLRTLIHESVHASVTDFIFSNPKHKLVGELRGMMAEAKRRSRRINKAEIGTTYYNVYNKLYGMVSLDEFLAETISNDQMKRFLILTEKHASSGWKAKRLLGEFARTVRKILGVSDVVKARLLDDILGASRELMEVAEQAGSPAKGRTVAAAPKDREQAAAPKQTPRLTPLGDQLAATGYEIDEAAESAKLNPGPEDPVVYTQNGIGVTRAEIRAMFTLGHDAMKKIPGVLIAEGKLQAWYRRFAATYVPEALSPDAKYAGALVAKFIVTRKWKTAMETTGSRKRRKFWLQNSDRHMEFIKGYEAGKKFLDETFNEAAAGYRAWMAELAAADQAKGIHYQPRDNYITHLFEDEDAVQAYMLKKYGRKAGDPYFMKDRSFEAYEDAIAAGYKPRFTNPEDIMMARVEASNIAHMRVDILNDFAEAGLAVPIKQGRKGALLTKRPEGFAKEPRRSPNGKKYWVQEDADIIWRNAFDTQSMWTRKDIWGSIYRGGMHIKNTYVPIQLWGLFHAVHVGLIINNAASLTRAFKSVLAGKWDAQTGKELLSAFNPVGGWWDKGAYKLLKAYWGQVKYEDLSDGDKMMMQFMNEGGMVPAMAEQDRISAHQKFFDALDSKKYSVLTPFHMFATILRGMQYPMFHIWIPQMKIASYARDVATAIHLDPTLMEDPKRRTLMFRQLAKSIDNRFGEMSYDTLFWNKTIKDIFVLNTLSLGWQLGFIREYVQGSTVDVMRQITSEKSVAEMAKSGMLDRTLFSSFYMAMGMMIGAMIHYASTGEPPEEFEDYLLPKTGEKNPDGTDRRRNTPFYTREIASMQKHVQNEGLLMGLAHLAKNKASGVVGLTWAAVAGVDSLGREVRDPNSMVLQQTAQTLQYLFKEAWPISFEAVEQEGDAGLGDKALAFAGFTPAAKYLMETPVEGAVKGKYLKYFGQKRTPYDKAQMSDSRRELREAYESGDYATYDKIITKFEKEFDLTPNEIGALEDSVQSGENPYLSMFGRLQWKDQKAILDRHWHDMTDEEKYDYLERSNEEHLRYNYEPPRREK